MHDRALAEIFTYLVLHSLNHIHLSKPVCVQFF